MRSFVSKSAAVAALCVAVLASSAFAAKGDDKGTMKASKAFEPIRTALTKVTNLTDDEKTKTTQIIDDAVAQASAMSDEKKADKADATAAGDKAADPKERRQKMMDLQKKTADSIEAALTADQKTEFTTALKEARQAMRGAGKAGGGGAEKPAETPADPAK